MNDHDLVKTITKPQVFDIIVVGGGVAGLTAGLYAARDGYKTLVLEGTPLSATDLPGGALMLTSEIANFPGYKAGAGMDLIDSMREQTEEAGAYIIGERAISIDISSEKGKCHGIEATDGISYRGRAIIIATGAVAKTLNVPGEAEMFGRGVSTCATCDGFFFTDKEVVVVGGGDTAVEDALLLTKFASKVNLFVRGDKLKATGPEAREILTHPDVKVHWNTHLQEIHHDNSNIQKVTYAHPEGVDTLSTDGVFIAIGSNPATKWLKNSNIVLDEEGYILVEPSSTKILGMDNGIFAAGDVADKVYRQAVTSAGKAAQAVIEARGYLQTQHSETC